MDWNSIRVFAALDKDETVQVEIIQRLAYFDFVGIKFLATAVYFVVLESGDPLETSE
jgi:hypothetical protein